MVKRHIPILDVEALIDDSEMVCTCGEPVEHEIHLSKKDGIELGEFKHLLVESDGYLVLRDSH